MKLTDTHCHLYFNNYKDDLKEVLDHAWNSGVQMIVVPGIDIETSQKALELTQMDERIFAAVGIHPNSAMTWGQDSAKILADMVQHPRAVAIGEIGLDYYRNAAPRDVQSRVLDAQLEIAAEQHKPVILHNRDASDDLYPRMLQWEKMISTVNEGCTWSPGVFHSFGRDHPAVAELIQARFFFGISGPVTFLNNTAMVKAVENLPNNRILIETDSPFLTPHPHRGTRNEPGFVNLIANRIAEIKSISPEQTASQTYENAAHLFLGAKIIE